MPNGAETADLPNYPRSRTADRVCCRLRSRAARALRHLAQFGRWQSASSFEAFHVGAILVPTGRTLVRQQVGESEHRDAHAFHRLLDPVRPRLLEREAGNPGEDVNAVRRQAELRYDVEPREVLFVQVEVVQRRTEVGECVPDPPRVVSDGSIQTSMSTVARGYP